MSYQKYNLKPKTIFYDPRTGQILREKTKESITFRSGLEYEVYQRLNNLIDCEVICQVPIKGKSFVWNVDFMLRGKSKIGKALLNVLRDALPILSTGYGGVLYIEAKGAITKEFAEKLTLCRKECPNIYKNLLAFGDNSLGVVMEENFNVCTFPILSTDLLSKLVLHCNNEVVKRLTKK